MKTFKQKYGEWAIVTGASSGMGREMARQLAAKGVNVAVVARREERLNELVAELEQTAGVKARAIAVDLTAANFLQQIDEATSDLDVGLLINNAGAAAPGAFLKQSIETRLRNVQLNVNSPMALAYHFGEKFVARGRGGIIFVSSIVAYTGSPYMANYAATKAYSRYFAESLHLELKPKGVDVLVVLPGATRTEMVEMEGADMGKMPMPWMNADEVARVALGAIGRKSSVIPGVMNNLMMSMMGLMPARPALKLFGSMMKQATATELQ